MGIGFDETSMTGVMRHQIAGDLIMDGDPGYNEARRVWNSMIDRRPRAIIRASAASDIGPAVALAREHGLRLAVRGGGHSVAGHATVDGGLVLDLGALRAVAVDPRRRIVRVQPGATLADGRPGRPGRRRLTGPGRRCLPDLVPGQRRVMPHDERMAAPASRPMSGMPAKGPWELAIVYRGSV